MKAVTQHEMNVLEFSKYEDFIHAFTQHEIKTITKYNIHNRSPNFEIDTNIHTFLNTFTSEKDLKARVLWKYQHKEDAIYLSQ